jgi:hypothetical protein
MRENHRRNGGRDYQVSSAKRSKRGNVSIGGSDTNSATRSPRVSESCMGSRRPKCYWATLALMGRKYTPRDEALAADVAARIG